MEETLEIVHTEIDPIQKQAVRAAIQYLNRKKVKDWKGVPLGYLWANPDKAANLTVRGMDIEIEKWRDRMEHSKENPWDHFNKYLGMK